MNSQFYEFVKVKFCLIIIFCLLCGIVVAQQPGKPILITEITGEDGELDLSEYIYRIVEKTRANFRNYPEGIVAVRICSSEPLPIALDFGIDHPFLVAERLRKDVDAYRDKYFDKKITEIVFLKSNKNCRRFKSGLFPTQYWFVPKGVDFPEFIEYKKLDDISKENLIFENFLRDKFLKNQSIEDTKSLFLINGKFFGTEENVQLTPETYLDAKKKIASLLKEHRTAYLLINTPDTVKERRKINPKAIELKTYLIKQGIGSHRIFIKQCSRCYSYIYEAESEEFYPEVSIIYQ